MIKVLVISENVLFAETLVKVFETDETLDVLCMAPKKSKIIKSLKVINPVVVIFDVYGLSDSKIKLIKELYKIVETAKCGLIVNEHDFQLFNVKLFIDLGFKGIITKESSLSEFVGGIRQMHLDKYYFSNEIMQLLLKGNKSSLDAAVNHKDKQKTLNIREIEVLKSICEGRTNKETSERLYLSPRTIQWHRANLMHKVGAKNTSHLIMYAIKNGYYNSLD